MAENYTEKPDGVVISSMPDDSNEDIILPEAEWKDLTFNELLNQKSMLYDKYIFLYEKNNMLYKDFEGYINKIDVLIQAQI